MCAGAWLPCLMLIDLENWASKNLKLCGSILEIGRYVSFYKLIWLLNEFEITFFLFQSVFGLYDKDRSGALSGFELRQALNSAGYHLNNPILNILMHRYGNKRQEIEFDDFIMCAVKLKTMMGEYQHI